MLLSPHAPSTRHTLPLGTRGVLAAVAMLAMFFAFINPVPARADGAASTRNIILAAAAITAGIIIANNVHHKQVAHDTVVGRTADGGVVYADGRIVYPNGDVLYTGNGNGRPCGWGGYGDEEPCGSRATAYYPRGYNGHDHGNHYGWYKEKHHEHGEHEGGDHHEGGNHDGGN